MMTVVKYVKRNCIPFFLLILGCLIFFWVKDYKQVPSGIGPAFFPRVIAAMMILLSLAYLVLYGRKEPEGEFIPAGKSGAKILISSAIYGVSGIIMQHVHVIPGIFVFFLLYLLFIVKMRFRYIAAITVLGTLVLSGAVYLLKIPM